MPHPLFGAKDVCQNIEKKVAKYEVMIMIASWGGQLVLYILHDVLVVSNRCHIDSELQ